MVPDGLIIDGFSGPGGWCEAARSLGLGPVAGFEIDAAACATRAAAGHLTVRADMSRYPVARLPEKVWGMTHSAPCIVFSGAGKRGGIGVMQILAEAARDQFAGRATLAQRRREMVHELRCSCWGADTQAEVKWDRKRQRAWKRKLLARKGSYAKLSRAMTAAAKTAGRHPTRAQRSAKIWDAVRSASLAAEPARWITACHPEWIALEQVPEVLPLWRVYAGELRRLGYSTWVGKLDAADYGVPQNRVRAILIASRVRTVSRPVPTHYDPRKGDQLWGTPWVSMAQALGWGATGRSAPTVTAGGAATGGAEPFGHRDRDALSAEREAGRWALRIDAQAKATCRPGHAPADTIKAGHSSGEMRWVLRSAFGEPGEGSGTHEMDTAARPAHAVTTKARSFAPGSGWKFRNNNNNACTRSPDEPAGTLFFGGRSNWAAWVRERPATTVVSEPRLSAAGHSGYRGESQSTDSVRITVPEAAVLQSFRPSYPWQGSKTAQFGQVGNAVPPLLAIAVIGVATGADWQPAAGRYSASLREVSAT